VMSMLAPHWGQLYCCHVPEAPVGWYCAAGCGLACNGGLGTPGVGLGGCAVAVAGGG